MKFNYLPGKSRTWKHICVKIYIRLELPDIIDIVALSALLSLSAHIQVQ